MSAKQATLSSASALPVFNGVGASCVALPSGDWTTIAEFLFSRFPQISRGTWVARIAAGNVLDQFGCAVTLTTSYRPNSRVFYYRAVEAEGTIPFVEKIVYQDEFIVVADKPHFLPVTPSGPYVQETLLTRLRRSLGLDTLTPVHRIDRDTAGLVLFAIDPSTRDRYHALFRERKIKKVYEAIAPSESLLSFPFTYRSRIATSKTFMQMHEVEGEPNSETLIDKREVVNSQARYLLYPLTGQKHQLRLHMASRGIPISNDRIYPVIEPAHPPGDIEQYDRPLQLLAKSVEFIDPITGAAHYFKSGRSLRFSV